MRQRAPAGVIAVEVKSGRARDVQPGMAAFSEAFKAKRMLLIGGDEITVEDFLSRPVEYWI